MKSRTIPCTQWILVIFFAMTTVCGFAQRTITWKGGTPGMTNDWFCPQNWSSTSLPDEFSDVIIPDVSSSTFAPPCITEGTVEINSLMLQSNATLSICYNASLIVISHMEGLDHGKVKGEGQLIRKEDLLPMVTRMMALRP